MKKPTLSTAAASRIRAEAKRIMGKAAVILAMILCGMVAQAKRVPLLITLGSGATPIITSGDIACQWVTFQDNATHPMSLGSLSVTLGHQVSLQSGGGSFYLASVYGRTYGLAGWYVIGTAGDQIDVVCEDGQ